MKLFHITGLFESLSILRSRKFIIDKFMNDADKGLNCFIDGENCFLGQCFNATGVRMYFEWTGETLVSDDINSSGVLLKQYWENNVLWRGLSVLL